MVSGDSGNGSARTGFVKSLLTLARRLWVPIFLAACAIYLALHAETLLRDNPVPTPSDPGLLWLALLVQAAVWIALADAWRHVIRLRLGRQTALGQALTQFALFSFGKYLPGKIWGAAARAVNMGREGVAVDESLDATIFEQYLVLHSAAALSALLLPLLVPGWLPWALAVLALGTAPFGARVVERALPPLTRLLRPAAFPHSNPADRPKVSIAAGLGMIGRYAAAWALHGAVLVVLYASLSGGLQALDARTVGLLVLGNTAGMVAGFAAVFAPAGLGVREAAMAAILATGMPAQDAITLSIAMRLWTVATDVGLGGAILLARRWY